MIVKHMKLSSFPAYMLQTQANEGLLTCNKNVLKLLE